METLGGIKMELFRLLRDNGAAEPEWEARQLLCHVTGLSTEKCVASAGMYLSDDAVEKLRTMARWRTAGMPLGYLFGEWDFYGLRFTVTPEVLIPRQDTETLCRAALDLLPDEGRVLDLCCGSGCLGLCIAHFRPRATVVLADISEKALAVAEENKRRIRPEGFVLLVRADALEAPTEQIGRFNLIVCNPPYISADEWDCLDPSVRSYEPKLALYGGEDGLDFYRSLARSWMAALRPRGHLCLELGWTQADAVCGLLEQNGFCDLRLHHDTAGIRRVVTARRPTVE